MKMEEPTKDAPPMPIITPADLRLELPISASTLIYKFPVLTTDTSPATTNGSFITENRLSQSDSFWAILCGLYLCVPSGATSAEFKLYSYPSPTLLTAAKAAIYDVFYNNSVMNITINAVEYITNFATIRFRRTPITQEGLGATSSTAAPANIPSSTIDAFDGNNDGLTPLGTYLELSGLKTNLIQIVLPAALSAAAVSNSRLVWYGRGFRAINAAER